MKYLRKIIDKINLRQRIILAIMGLFILVYIAMDSYLLPAMDDLDQMMTRTEAKTAELARLKANLDAGKGLGDTLRTYQKQLIQTDKDEIVLSTFLRGLEEKARYPSMRIVNMRPNPIETKGSCKLYSVKMAVVGEIQDLLKFFKDVMAGDIVGLKSLSLRGVQGGSGIECGVTLYMVRISSR